MLKILLDTINREKLISIGDGVLIGVSGGPDSISLLYALNELREKLDIRIVVVHLNHLFRDDAYLDANYVKKISDSLNIKSYIFEKDISLMAKENGMSFEEAGRIERYRLFNEVRKKENLDVIAIAQNKNDQAETVLMRLIRGTGLKGLTGIEYKRNDGVIRPILDVDRKLIEKYCEDNNLNPRRDYTNFEDVYFRNKVRLNLIPYIENEFNVNIIDKTVRTSSILRGDEDFLEKYTSGLVNEIFYFDLPKSTLDRDRYLNLHLAIRKRLIRLIVKKINGDINDLSFNDIESINRLIINNRQGAKFYWKNVIFETEYSELKIYIDKKNSKEDYLSKNLDLKIMEASEAAHCQLKNKNEVFLDYEKIEGQLSIRYRKNGDSFVPYGMNTHKKLSRYFIDKKVAKDLRDFVPLICDKDNIVWVYGFSINDNYKITKKTKKVIALKLV